MVPGDSPDHETILEHGELILGVVIPTAPFAARSHYLKVRERASYEFALVSAAVALELDGKRIRQAHIALGGVAPKPWRLTRAEDALAGGSLETSALRTALEESFAEAKPRRHNGFKIELAKRAVIRALQTAGEKA